MGLTYCSGCQLIEGPTQEDEHGNVECGECQELIEFVPEHDDFEER
jgi:hypothetical protein